MDAVRDTTDLGVEIPANWQDIFDPPMNWHKQLLLDIYIAQRRGFTVRRTKDNSFRQYEVDSESVRGYSYERLAPCSSRDEYALRLWNLVPIKYTPRLQRVLKTVNGKTVYQWEASIFSDDGTISACEDTIALAICKCWLMFGDSN